MTAEGGEAMTTGDAPPSSLSDCGAARQAQGGRRRGASNQCNYIGICASCGCCVRLCALVLRARTPERVRACLWDNSALTFRRRSGLSRVNEPTAANERSPSRPRFQVVVARQASSVANVAPTALQHRSLPSAPPAMCPIVGSTA